MYKIWGDTPKSTKVYYLNPKDLGQQKNKAEAKKDSKVRKTER
jgi:hypothetical protein